MQENQVKHPKRCVYWIGSFDPLVFTADMETLKGLIQLPGGINVYMALCVLTQMYTHACIDLDIYQYAKQLFNIS